MKVSDQEARGIKKPADELSIYSWAEVDNDDDDELSQLHFIPGLAGWAKID